jgi:hypothetical protein
LLIRDASDVTIGSIIQILGKASLTHNVFLSYIMPIYCGSAYDVVLYVEDGNARATITGWEQ